ncbi:MAG TPA: nucleotidyltransferase domain-containing protein [Chloroflexota bacterium]|nr:nucleotidyltransferase domain-containing protein [Chloroflexota bacterium]
MDREPPPAVEDRIRRALPTWTEESAGELVQIIECLVATFHPARIYAYGSQVRDEAGPDSDLDLLIVVPRATEPAHRLAQAAYHALPVHSLPIDILVMSADEFESRSRAAASLPATVRREGRTLYAA